MAEHLRGCSGHTNDNFGASNATAAHGHALPADMSVRHQRNPSSNHDQPRNANADPGLSLHRARIDVVSLDTADEVTDQLYGSQNLGLDRLSARYVDMLLECLTFDIDGDRSESWRADLRRGEFRRREVGRPLHRSWQNVERARRAERPWRDRFSAIVEDGGFRMLLDRVDTFLSDVALYVDQLADQPTNPHPALYKDLFASFAAIVGLNFRSGEATERSLSIDGRLRRSKVNLRVHVPLSLPSLMDQPVPARPKVVATAQVSGPSGEAVTDHVPLVEAGPANSARRAGGPPEAVVRAGSSDFEPVRMQRLAQDLLLELPHSAFVDQSVGVCVQGTKVQLAVLCLSRSHLEAICSSGDSALEECQQTGWLYVSRPVDFLLRDGRDHLLPALMRLTKAVRPQ